MEMKKVTKRLFAIGTGVLMLGATAMGALAAVDLKDYPSMFVKNGTFNGYLVVGENAKPIDNLAMTDIAASMKYQKPSETSTVSVSGDAWKVGTSAKKLEMANSNAAAGSITGEQIYDISTFISKDELKALASGTYSTGDGEYNYNQYIYLDTGNVNTNEIVKFAEDDNDKVADFFYVQSGKNIGKYVLEFTSPAQSDVTDSSGSASTTGTYLKDFENTKINMLGKEYTIVMARRPNGATGSGSIKLVLMSGAVKDSVLEGEEKTYTVDGKEYKVKLVFVDGTYAKFTINGETTDKLQVGETKKLADGKEVGLSEVLYQSYAGGVHSASFFLGAGKVELRDNTVDETTDTSDYGVLLSGNDEVDGTQVFVDGSDNNVTFRLNSIAVNMSAEDDFYVGAGEKLSDVLVAAGEEEEALFTNNWDIEYKGLTTEKTHAIKLTSSTDRKYTLVFYDGDNSKVDLPLAYAASDTTIQLSEDTADKAVIVKEDVAASKNDYLVLTGGDDTAGTAKTYVLQYKGADRSTKTNPKIQFKNIGNGESLEYSVSSSYPIATVKIGGNSFTVNASSTAVDDFPITMDLDGDATTQETANTKIVDYYGATIVLAGGLNASTARLGAIDNMTVTIGTNYTSDYDTEGPSALVTQIGAAATNEVTADSFSVGGAGNVLLNPTGEENVYYGYTSMGGKITYKTPSGQPAELTYDYPENQVLPQVYVTSGAITSSSTTGGTWTPVTIVDATKLDSEVADAKAQNLIVIGGPCVNSVAASLLGNPAACADGFTPGKAKVKLFENGANVAMLVAGYTGEDTRLAGKVIANRWKELSGSEVEVEGTTYTDAKIGAPAPKTE